MSLEPPFEQVVHLSKRRSVLNISATYGTRGHNQFAMLQNEMNYVVRQRELLIARKKYETVNASDRAVSSFCQATEMAVMNFSKELARGN